MTDRELMQMALDALEYSVPSGYGPTELYDDAIEALRSRLLQPEPEPLTLWTEAQHERAYRNSPELHKDVKSLAAFKRVAKEIAAMYGIKGDA